ncbi:MAG: pyridoxal 5'-phosphate synthase glutaminase subunit PdxT [Methanomicrobiales archaeon]|nr:pyridoxal 5'-phosphate synthase glutaminase subunit PdxT [Methanomicrobiales archaeon]
MAVRIGVFALQGDVHEHLHAFRTALTKRESPGEVVPVRNKRDLAPCDAFVIPGGESTTISRLIQKNDLFQEIREYDGAIFATCAGMVLLGNDTSDARIQPLGIMDMGVERNAFGRQKESFESDIEVKGLNSPFHAVFIRAPVVTRVGQEIEVLARIPEGIVGVRKELHIAFSFHPELTGDLRLHELFLESLELR